MPQDSFSPDLVRRAFLDPLNPAVPLEAGLRKAIRAWQLQKTPLIRANLSLAVNEAADVCKIGERRSPNLTAYLYQLVSSGDGTEFAYLLASNLLGEIAYLAANFVPSHYLNGLEKERVMWSISTPAMCMLADAGLHVKAFSVDGVSGPGRKSIKLYAALSEWKRLTDKNRVLVLFRSVATNYHHITLGAIGPASFCIVLAPDLKAIAYGNDRAEEDQEIVELLKFPAVPQGA